MKQRDVSVDLLKFFAVFLIINSHMDALYPKFKMLATGGAIGDALFLFCSGYTLLLSSRQLRFDNWYKRRINRIYPSVFVCALVGCLFQMNGTLSVLTLGGGEFILAIMVYYMLIYGINKYLKNCVLVILVLIFMVSWLVYMLWYPYKYELGEQGIYGITTLFRWIPYFGYMMLGAYVGLKRPFLHFRPVVDFLLLMTCLILFYGIQLGGKIYPVVAPFQILTILPLLGIVFYFYKWCNAGFWKKIYDNNKGYAVIMTVSGLCLESYLIQYSVFTTKMNCIFPLNLPVMVIIVLLASYLCKCLSRVFLQTFGEGDYNWRAVLKLY
ncbi:acyltransferase family protein [Parabacteroides chongii]|uniref:acyltransferase family protein n=1 Tax=Parabacteroides chongii TaxID=2685834 RepID=UPI00240DE013|nr:acyltransferase family protein [Parabacteroides chongii]WFE83107.1 hypothetical protein P3L47_13230 [Parabacteroides chongii]